jgi:hypothetical protein
VKTTKRVAAAFSVLVVLPLAIGIAALAETTHVRQPISFTIPPTCPDLRVTVEGTGEMFVVTNHRIDSNGVDHVEMNTLATGTATDSEGATYKFNYHNHVSLEVPPGGFPVSVTGTDHFNLVGKGKANQLHVGFVARATVNGPNEPPTIERLVNMRGEAFFCDPI